jgi:hypothetical protein
MPFRREYFPSDTLKLINKSEGRLVRDGKQRDPTADEKLKGHQAHSVGRHLAKGAPGGLGHGAPKDQIRDRFLADPYDDKGELRMSSGWLGKGDMAVLLCELLNSPAGQAGLGGLDSGAGRVGIHYVNEGKLEKLFGGLVGQLKMLSGEIRVSAVAPTLLYHEGEKNPKRGQIRKIVYNKYKALGVLRERDVAAVHAVLDAFGNELHLQTLFPSVDLEKSYAEWKQGGVVINVIDDGKGNINRLTLPA